MSSEARRAYLSCLTAPGPSPKMATKASLSSADMVTIDLEDAIAPFEKEAPRSALVKGHRILAASLASCRIAPRIVSRAREIELEEQL